MHETAGDTFVLSIEPRAEGGDPLVFAFAGQDLLLAGDALLTLAFEVLAKLPQSTAEQRSRMIAANNIINALFMVLGAGAAAAMAASGVDAPGVLKVAAVANLVAAAWVTMALRQATSAGKMVSLKPQ